MEMKSHIVLKTRMHNFFFLCKHCDSIVSSFVQLCVFLMIHLPVFSLTSVTELTSLCVPANSRLSVGVF